MAGRWWVDQATLVDLPSADAASEGIDPGALGALAERMAGKHRSKAFLVARRGSLVLERYAAEPWFSIVPERALRLSIASMSKGLVGGMVLAIGVCEGWLDPDAPVGRHVASWRDDARRRSVTPRDLATHTSGLAGAPGRPAGAEAGAGRTSADWARTELRAGLSLREVPFVAESGTKCATRTRATRSTPSSWRRRPRPPATAPTSRASYRTGCSAPWASPSGRPSSAMGGPSTARARPYREVGSGARFTARAVVRVGEMVAGGGAWNGRPIVDRRCLDEALRPNLAAAPAGDVKADQPAPAPAAGWWSNANRAWPELPTDLLLAAGAEHRVVVVVPSLDLVAVRLGPRFGDDHFGGDYWSLLRTELLGPLLEAVRPGAALIADMPRE
jgi:CubicO group peptidase (beta-lactamase class C family)